MKMETKTNLRGLIFLIWDNISCGQRKNYEELKLTI